MDINFANVHKIRDPLNLISIEFHIHGGVSFFRGTPNMVGFSGVLQRFPFKPTPQNGYPTDAQSSRRDAPREVEQVPEQSLRRPERGRSRRPCFTDESPGNRREKQGRTTLHLRQIKVQGKEEPMGFSVLEVVAKVAPKRDIQQVWVSGSFRRNQYRQGSALFPRCPVKEPLHVHMKTSYYKISKDMYIYIYICTHVYVCLCRTHTCIVCIICSRLGHDLTQDQGCF